MEIVWKIVNAQSYKNIANQSDVVFSVTWQCTASKTVDEKTYSDSLFGTSELPIPDQWESFVSYENLTEEILLNWIHVAGANKQAIEAQLSESVQEQIDRPIQAKPLPWMAA